MATSDRTISSLRSVCVVVKEERAGSYVRQVHFFLPRSKEGQTQPALWGMKREPGSYTFILDPDTQEKD